MSPHYYEQFVLSQGKESPYIFSWYKHFFGSGGALSVRSNEQSPMWHLFQDGVISRRLEQPSVIDQVEYLYLHWVLGENVTGLVYFSTGYFFLVVYFPLKAERGGKPYISLAWKLWTPFTYCCGKKNYLYFLCEIDYLTLCILFLSMVIIFLKYFSFF